MRHLPVLTSHNRSDSSKEPEASRLPCGLKLTQKTKLACPRSVLSIFPEATLQTLIVRSSEALARYRLSAEKEASDTPCVCPRSVCAHFHSLPTPSVFQRRIVISAELLASQRPSGENLIQETARRWPVSVFVHTYRDGAACVLGFASSEATTGDCASAMIDADTSAAARSLLQYLPLRGARGGRAAAEGVPPVSLPMRAATCLRRAVYASLRSAVAAAAP